MKTIRFERGIFRKIPNDDRFVSRDGRILSMRQGCMKILRSAPDKDGYLKVSRPEIKIHHAVLLAWKGPRPAGAQARHLNGRRTVNLPANLAWGTATENGQDKRLHGSSKGIKNPAARMTEAMVLRLREDYVHKSLSVICRENPCLSKFALWAAMSGYTWSHLPGAIPRGRKCFKA
jgi:hypothetical protein